MSDVRMADPPRLTKLGAKWVEVRKRRAQGVRKWRDEGVLKTWPATPVMHRSLQAGRGCPKLVGVASLMKGSSRGRSAIRTLSIADCELALENSRWE